MTRRIKIDNSFLNAPLDWVDPSQAVSLATDLITVLQTMLNDLAELRNYSKSRDDDPDIVLADERQGTGQIFNEFYESLYHVAKFNSGFVKDEKEFWEEKWYAARRDVQKQQRVMYWDMTKYFQNVAELLKSM